MIETSNPEIDVNALMERVRREAAEIASRGAPNGPIRVHRSGLPNIRELPPPPPLGLSKPFDVRKERVETALEKARRMLAVGRWIPKIFRTLFRDQNGFNHAALDAIAILAKNSVQLSKRLHEVMTIVQQQDEWMHQAAAHRQIEAVWMKAAAPVLAEVSSLREQIAALTNQLSNAAAQADSRADELRKELAQAHGTFAERLTEVQTLIGENLAEVQRRIHEKEAQLSARHVATDTDLHNHQAQLDRAAADLRTIREEFDLAGEHLRNLQLQVDGACERLVGVTSETAQLRDHELKLGHAHDRLEIIQAMLNRLEERQANDAIYLKGELALQRSRSERVSGTTRGAKSRRAPSAEPEAPDTHALDNFYFNFENRFRGKRSEIKERVRFYLPLLREAHAGNHDRPVLDLGCGRGEWLEVIKEEKLEGTGVDLNTAMIAQCEERGLKALEANALAHLRQLDDSSYGAVTAFHLIEHLPLSELLQLVTESFRILRPGGIAIFESPNCKNLTVGACYFNIDPTHRNPVFPETSQFMLEATGFHDVRLEYLSPASDSPFDGSDDVSLALTKILFGPQDFAVIGRKPPMR